MPGEHRSPGTLSRVLLGFAACVIACGGNQAAPQSPRAMSGVPSPTHAEWSKRLAPLADVSGAVLGVCVQDASAAAPTCIHGERRFALQSVMKLPAAAALLDAVDHHRVALDEPVDVRREDLSGSMQSLADLVAKHGVFKTTLDDLMARAVVESDNAAVDILLRRLGGPGVVQAFLRDRGFHGIRIDRDERHLQTETAGLVWRPEYVDAKVFQREQDALPEAMRDKALQAYLKDERDTATPSGMTTFLHALASGKVLSPASTAHLLSVMKQTTTGPDRLKAGLPAGWTIGHKTGTSGTWKGVTAATNDVGVLMAPDGRWVAVTVFVGESTLSADERAALIARVAREVTAGYAGAPQDPARLPSPE